MKDSRSLFHYFGANSGSCVSYTDPKPEQIDPQDIALSLSRQGRGLGHDAASIAQHCLIATFLMFDLCRNLPKPLRVVSLLHALFHDAHEAYTGDIPMPLKTTLRDMWAASIEKEEPQGDVLVFDPIKTVEIKLDRAIWGAFKLEPPTEEIRSRVRECDRMAIALEMRDVMSPARRQTFLASGYTFLDPRSDVFISVLSQPEAEQAYLEGMAILEELRNGRFLEKKNMDVRPIFRNFAGLRCEPTQ